MRSVKARLFRRKKKKKLFIFVFVFFLADIVFSTAHKAKGLEFDTVRVTDDFLPGTDIGVPLRK